MKLKYIAHDPQGKRISDVAVADDVGSLVARLKTGGLLPVKVYEVQSSQSEWKKMISKFKSSVKGKELAVFTRQLAATLSAGLLLTESLDTIMDDLENEYFREVIKKVVTDIRGGSSFSVALRKHPKVFPHTYTSIIKSGEATGNLDKTLTDMALYLEDAERLKEKVKSAVAYPLFVFGFACFVVFVIVVFLIPKFKGLFDTAHAKLPLLTRIVMGVSDFTLHNILWVFIAAVLAGIAIWRLLKFPQVRYKADVMKFKIPILGKGIIYKSTVSRFCRTLSVLLAGGVGMAVSLEITRDTVDHLPMAEAIEKIRARVLSGSSLADEIRAQKIFPSLVAKMTAVGQRTGRIDNMLERTADYYEDELENTLKKLASLLEPALIIFVGGIVLFVILALYLPIFNLSSAIR